MPRIYVKTMRLRVIKALDNASDPLSAKQISAVAHTSVNHIRKELNALVAEGLAHIAAVRKPLQGGRDTALYSAGPLPEGAEVITIERPAPVSRMPAIHSQDGIPVMPRDSAYLALMGRLSSVTRMDARMAA